MSRDKKNARPCANRRRAEKIIIHCYYSRYGRESQA